MFLPVFKPCTGLAGVSFGRVCTFPAVVPYSRGEFNIVSLITVCCQSTCTPCMFILAVGVVAYLINYIFNIDMQK